MNVTSYLEIVITDHTDTSGSKIANTTTKFLI